MSLFYESLMLAFAYIGFNEQNCFEFNRIFLFSLVPSEMLSVRIPEFSKFSFLIRSINETRRQVCFKPTIIIGAC